jgi:hypothetical protein
LYSLRTFTYYLHTIFSTHNLLQETKSVLSTKFNINDLGEASSVLSIEILQDHCHGTLQLRQAGHINSLLTKLGLTDCKPHYTPMNVGLSLSSVPSEHTVIPYQQAIGGLRYIAQAS